MISRDIFFCGLVTLFTFFRYLFSSDLLIEIHYLSFGAVLSIEMNVMNIIVDIDD